MKKPCEDTPWIGIPPTHIRLDVSHYGLNVIAGSLDGAVTKPKIQDATAVLKICGTSKPEGWNFWVYVYPNGSRLDPAFLRLDTGRVEMAIHESQLASMMAALTGSNAAHAVYSVDERGIVYSDVHAEFTKPPEACCCTSVQN